MKPFLFRTWLLLAFTTILLAGCTSSSNVSQVPGPDGSITYQTFYDDLSPYGTWIDYPGYGNVWNPRVDGDFRPYATNGYWNYSNDGWAWNSSYSWGWAPFHYGRWLYDDAYGWLWVPGYDWSPAWVTWGYMDNNYCWAPLMPGVNAGVQFGGWRPHDFYWNVCGRDHIYDRNLGAALQRPGSINNISSRVTMINNYATTNIHNQYYSRGPAVNEVEKYTNRKIDPVNFREVNSSNQVKHEGNEMRVYRPQVQNPQPREFRRVQSNEVNPVKANDKWPSAQPNMQRSNIEQLPVRRMGGFSPAGGGGMRSGGGGVRRGR
jgi:hypothetical protein